MNKLTELMNKYEQTNKQINELMNKLINKLPNE